MSVVGYRPRSFGGIRLEPRAWHTDDGLTVWDLEALMDDVARQADGCECQAVWFDGEGRSEDCEVWLDLSEGLWGEWNILKHQLDQLEAGW